MAESNHTHQSAHQPANASLECGAGRGKLLFLDCPSGIAGDMVLAALLDLGVPLAVVEEALRTLPLTGYRLAPGHAHLHGITATTLRVVLEGEPASERDFRTIDQMLLAAPLEGETRRLARAIFRRLAEAEAAVHATPVDDVTFHEVGAEDSIVDIVGAAAACAFLGATIHASPLPLGRGFVSCRHGTLPLPAPATVHCLRGVPTYGADLDVELVTPTGAAIVATLAARFERWPAFRPGPIGYGAGSRSLPDRPNVLRAVLGEPSGTAGELTEPCTHWLVECNVDDLTGELAGHALDALLDAGALDAWAAPITMKKGRPGLKIAALATATGAQQVAKALLRETTTIGVRRLPVMRTERARREVPVETRFGTIAVKVSTGHGVASQVKPEFDACAAAARAHGVPVRVVLAETLAAYRARAEEDGDEE